MASETKGPGFIEKWKLPLYAFAAGLIVGPLLSGALGWQVTSSTLNESVSEAVMKQQAEACAHFARQEVKDTERLDFSQRRDVAEKYAKLPWDDSDTFTLRSRCQDILSEKAPDEPEKTG